MTRALRGVVAAVAGLVLLAGCASGPVAGTVVEKAYDDPDSGVISTVSCVPSGKTTFCTPILVPYSDGPHWSLLLEDADGETGWVEVTQASYDATDVGDYVDTRPEAER